MFKRSFSLIDPKSALIILVRERLPTVEEPFLFRIPCPRGDDREMARCRTLPRNLFYASPLSLRSLLAGFVQF